MALFSACTKSNDISTETWLVKLGAEPGDRSTASMCKWTHDSTVVKVFNKINPDTVMWNLTGHAYIYRQTYLDAAHTVPDSMYYWLYIKRLK